MKSIINEIACGVWVLISSLILFTVSCDRELSVTPPDPPPPAANLQISTIPDGYSIFMNDRITGYSTPHSLKYLTSGEFHINLKHPYYLDTTITVTLDSNQIKDVILNMEDDSRFTGNIVVRSNPTGARIILDDSLLNKITPDTLKNLYPGHHKIALNSLGHRDYIKEVILKSNEKLNLYGALEDTTIWLTYSPQNSNMITDDLTCFAGPGRFIGTAGYGVIYRTESGSFENLGPTNMSISDITYLQDGTPVAVTFEGTIIEYVNNSWQSISNRFSEFPNSGVRSITQYNGQLFVSTGTRGVIIIVGNGYSFLNSIYPGLPLEINCFAKSYNSTMAVGSEESGLFLRFLNSTEWAKLNVSNSGIASNSVTAIDIGWDYLYKTEIYFAVKYAIQGGKLYLYKDPDLTEIDIDDSKVFSIHARQGRAWIGTNNGLYRIRDGVRVAHYSSENSPLPSNYIYEVYELADEIWMATGNGLVRFDFRKDSGG